MATRCLDENLPSYLRTSITLATTKASIHTGMDQNDTQKKTRKIILNMLPDENIEEIALST